MSGNAFSGLSLGLNAQNVFKYRDEKMCGKWNTVVKTVGPCNIQLMMNSQGNIVVNGTSNDLLKGISMAHPLHVKYWAANSATSGYSFTGSGHPFPNEEIAFQKSNNTGVAKMKNGKFSFNIMYPNSYMKNMGTVYVPPQIRLQFWSDKGALSGIHEVTLGNGIPFRSSELPKKRNWLAGPMFYNNPNLPVRGQEAILRASAYPSTNVEPNNFWGSMPPH